MHYIVHCSSIFSHRRPKRVIYITYSLVAVSFIIMQKLFQLSKRWELTSLLFSGIAILYCLRVNMSVAAQKLLIELNWSEGEKGLVLVSTYLLKLFDFYYVFCCGTFSWLCGIQFILYSEIDFNQFFLL